MRKDYSLKDGKLRICIENSWREVLIHNLECIDVIGTGANGVVIKCLQQPLERFVALKVWLPNKNSALNEVNKNQFLEEVKKIGKLDDPRIVPVYTVGESSGAYYSIMKYVNGQTLKSWSKQNAYVSSENRINIAKQIISTMKKCHVSHIYHGDLHSNNVIIDQEERPNILDFGTSYFVKKRNSKAEIERENVMISTLILTLLGDDKLRGFIGVSIPRTVKSPKLINDIREKDPILLLDALDGICQIKELLNMNNNFSNLDYMYEMAHTVMNTPYLSIRHISKYFFDIGGEPTLVNFWNCIDDNLHDWMNDRESLDNSTFIFYLTSSAYYQLIKNTVPSTTSEPLHTMIPNIVLYNEAGVMSLINFVLDSNNSTFVELIETLINYLPKGIYTSFIQTLRILMYSKLLRAMRLNKLTPPEVHYLIKSTTLEILANSDETESLRTIAYRDDWEDLDCVSKVTISSKQLTSASEQLGIIGMAAANDYLGHRYFNNC